MKSVPSFSGTIHMLALESGESTIRRDLWSLMVEGSRSGEVAVLIVLLSSSNNSLVSEGAGLISRSRRGSRSLSVALGGGVGEAKQGRFDWMSFHVCASWIFVTGT